MSNYDEKIRKAKKEIEKLTADIEKKKSRITELRAELKQLEVEKANQKTFNSDLLKALDKNGITSDEDRQAILAQIMEYARLKEQAKNSETATAPQDEEMGLEAPKVTSENNSEESSETKIQPTAHITENYHGTSNQNYQNYPNRNNPYRSQNGSGNVNS